MEREKIDFTDKELYYVALAFESHLNSRDTWISKGGAKVINNAIKKITENGEVENWVGKLDIEKVDEFTKDIIKHLKSLKTIYQFESEDQWRELRNKKAMKKIKSKMLTYLFKDWVKNETDLETLKISKQFIKKREIEIIGHVPILGFRSH